MICHPLPGALLSTRCTMRARQRHRIRTPHHIGGVQPAAHTWHGMEGRGDFPTAQGGLLLFFSPESCFSGMQIICRCGRCHPLRQVYSCDGRGSTCQFCTLLLSFLHRGAHPSFPFSFKCSAHWSAEATYRTMSFHGDPWLQICMVCGCFFFLVCWCFSVWDRR